MRVAVAAWEGRISPVFDTARSVVLVDIEGNEEMARREVEIGAQFPFQRAPWLLDCGVHILICGAVSRVLAEIITASGIRLIPFVAGEIDDVLKAFMRGELPNRAFLMPGCCGRRRRFRAGSPWRNTRGETEHENRRVISRSGAFQYGGRSVRTR
jgi:predicted Fe-Mo cluster-binding NifX family protein